MIIAISGKSGCGNTTVSTMLAEKLNLTLVNYTFRNLAQDTGKDFREICQAAKSDPSYDRYIDNHQVELAEKGNCVLGSRLAIWMVKKADLKVFLTASTETRVGRIHNREGGDINDVREATIRRDASDSARYMELYSIDNSKYDFADLVVDTEKYRPEQIVELIIEELKKRNIS